MQAPFGDAATTMPADSGTPAPSVPTVSDQWPYVMELGMVTETNFEVPPFTLGVHYDTTDPNYHDIVAARVADSLGQTVFMTDVPVGLPDDGTSYRALHPRSSQGLRMGISPGQWSMQAYGDIPILVYLQRASPAGYQGGDLSLHVHLAGGLTMDGSPVNAANAATHPGLQARIAAFYRMAEVLLWRRGEIAYHDAPAELARINYETDDDQVERAGSVSRSMANTTGLHLLIVNEIVGSVAGYAPFGGSVIPGLDNVVVEVEAPEDFASTLMHEMGHFVSLDHTTDLLVPGGGTDTIDDTPVCPASLDDLSQCPDYSNLMFPTGGSTLTADQIAIFRSNPVYRPTMPTTASAPAPAPPRSAEPAPEPFNEPAPQAHNQPHAPHVCGITMARAADAILSGRLSQEQLPWLPEISTRELQSWRRWGNIGHAFEHRLPSRPQMTGRTLPSISD